MTVERNISGESGDGSADEKFIRKQGAYDAFADKCGAYSKARLLKETKGKCGKLFVNYISEEQTETL